MIEQTKFTCSLLGKAFKKLKEKNNWGSRKKTSFKSLKTCWIAKAKINWKHLQKSHKMKLKSN